MCVFTQANDRKVNWEQEAFAYQLKKEDKPLLPHLIFPRYLCDHTSLRQKHTEMHMQRLMAQSWTNVCILFGHQLQKHSFIVNSLFESKREAHGKASLLAVSALFLFESNFKGYDKSHWSAFSACIVAVAMVAAISFRIIALNIMAKNRKLVSCNLVSVIWKAIQTRFVLWFIYPSIHPSIYLSLRTI